MSDERREQACANCGHDRTDHLFRGGVLDFCHALFECRIGANEGSDTCDCVRFAIRKEDYDAANARVAQLEAALRKARLDGAKEAISGMRRLMVQRFGSYGAPKEAMFSYDSDAEYVLAEIAAVLGEPA